MTTRTPTPTPAPALADAQVPRPTRETPDHSTPKAPCSAPRPTTTAWLIAVGLLSGALGFELLQTVTQLSLLTGGATWSAIATDLLGSAGRAALFTLVLLMLVRSRAHWRRAAGPATPRVVWLAAPLIASTHLLQMLWLTNL